MLEVADPERLYGEALDHLGLVASTIEDSSLIQEGDKCLPITKYRGAKSTRGQRITAMIPECVLISSKAVEIAID